MNRRDAIKRTSILLGSTLSAGAILGVMSGCQAEPTLDWTPEFLTTDEATIIESMVDIIIPRTDTPGAMDAGVQNFIDSMMSGYYTEEKKTAFREGLKKVNADAQAAHGKDYSKLSPEEQLALVEKYDQAAFGDNADEDHFFRRVKELTILGFCTSEVGANEFLKYDPLPGDYKGCIPYSDVGATWAT